MSSIKRRNSSKGKQDLEDDELDHEFLNNKGYKPIKEIGRGAVGRVTLVENIGSKPPTYYAIKRIGFNNVNSKEKNLAWAEAKVLSQIKHPWLIACQEIFEHRDSLHMVLEYAEQGDLEGRLKQFKRAGKKGLTVEEATRILAQVCFSLKWLHDQNILHRDLKPSNVLITAKGDAKLADLGICKMLENGVDLTKTMVGTPRYMSPECANRESYGRPADCWSLGCLLYEMLMLEAPFEASTLPAMVMMIVSNPTPKLPTRIPEGLANICEMLLKKKPKKRGTTDDVLRSQFLHPALKDLILNSRAILDDAPSPANTPSDQSKTTVIKKKKKEEQEDKSKTLCAEKLQNVEVTFTTPQNKKEEEVIDEIFYTPSPATTKNAYSPPEEIPPTPRLDAVLLNEIVEEQPSEEFKSLTLPIGETTPSLKSCLESELHVSEQDVLSTALDANVQFELEGDTKRNADLERRDLNTAEQVRELKRSLEKEEKIQKVESKQPNVLKKKLSPLQSTPQMQTRANLTTPSTSTPRTLKKSRAITPNTRNLTSVRTTKKFDDMKSAITKKHSPAKTRFGLRSRSNSGSRSITPAKNNETIFTALEKTVIVPKASPSGVKPPPPPLPITSKGDVPKPPPSPRPPLSPRTPGLTGMTAAAVHPNARLSPRPSMLRACMADAMSLSGAISKCDSAVSSKQMLNSLQLNPHSLRTQSKAQMMFEMPQAVNISGSCITTLCEDTSIWDESCGEKGFSSDLEHLTLAHNLEGTPFQFHSQKENQFAGNLNRMYTQEGESASNFALQNEDLMSQQATVLKRDLEKRNLIIDGGNPSDSDMCSGVEVDGVQWLRVAFEKCDGGTQQNWIQVTKQNRAFMNSFVSHLVNANPELVKDNTMLYAGQLSDLCNKFYNLEPAIQQQYDLYAKQTSEGYPIAAANPKMNNIAAQPSGIKEQSYAREPITQSPRQESQHSIFDVIEAKQDSPKSSRVVPQRVEVVQQEDISASIDENEKWEPMPLRAQQSPIPSIKIQKHQRNIVQKPRALSIVPDHKLEELQEMTHISPMPINDAGILESPITKAAQSLFSKLDPLM